MKRIRDIFVAAVLAAGFVQVFTYVAAWAARSPFTLGNVFTADVVDAGAVRITDTLYMLNANVASAPDDWLDISYGYISGAGRANETLILGQFGAQSDLNVSHNLALQGGEIYVGIPSYSTLVMGITGPDNLLEFQQDTGSTGTNTTVAILNTAGYLSSTTPHSWAMYINAVTTAATEFGGVVPIHDVLLTRVSFDISAAGTGGTSNAEFLITDGLSTCECPFACNAATGATSATCAGSCMFVAASPLQFFVNSIGDCVVGPAILGNATIDYFWQ